MKHKMLRCCFGVNLSLSL